MSNPWTSLYRIGWFVAAVLLVIGALFVFAPQIGRQQRLQAEKEQKERYAESLDAQIDDYQARQEKFRSDPSYVERVAREMGRVKPDEVVIKYERPDQMAP